MRFVPVLVLGLVSTALSLLGVYALDHAGMNLMGWYLEYVIPLGAMFVGIGASTGFGLGSWLTGRRLDGTLFLLVAGALAIAYFGAEYVDWRVRFPNGVVDDSGQLMGFWSCFDYMTRAIHFGNKDGLGLWGYLFRCLELGGFVCGGAFGILFVLSGRPYCAPCSRYQRLTPIALLPGDGAVALDAIAAATDDGRGLHAALVLHAPPSAVKDTERLDERMSLLLVRCPTCATGELRIDAVAGPPEQRVGQRVRAVPLSAPVVSDLLRARS